MNSDEHIKSLLAAFFDRHNIKKESIEFLCNIINQEDYGFFFITSTYGGLLRYSGGNPLIVSNQNELLINSFCGIETVEEHLNLPPFYDKWTMERVEVYEKFNTFTEEKLEALWMLWILTLTPNARREMDFISGQYGCGFEYFWEVAKYFRINSMFTGLLMLASNCYVMSHIILSSLMRPMIKVDKTPHMIVNLNKMDSSELYNCVHAMDTKTPVFVIASETLLQTNPSIEKIVMSHNRPNIRVFKTFLETETFDVQICVNEARAKTFYNMENFKEVTERFKAKNLKMLPYIVLEGSQAQPLIKEYKAKDLTGAVNTFLAGLQFPFNGYEGYCVNDHIRYLMESFDNTTAKYIRILIQKK